jgi:hypothetical protein
MLTGRRRGVALVAALCVVLGACGGGGEGDDASTGSSGPAPTGDATAYVVHDEPGWEVVDASTDVPEPPVSLLSNGQWRTEYVRSVETGATLDLDEVGVGGFQLGIDEAEDELERGGVAFDDADISPWHGVVGSYERDDDGPVIVLLEIDATTVSVLSYDLDEAELLEWTRDLSPATASAWSTHVGLPSP